MKQNITPRIEIDQDNWFTGDITPLEAAFVHKGISLGDWRIAFKDVFEDILPLAAKTDSEIDKHAIETLQRPPVLAYYQQKIKQATCEVTEVEYKRNLATVYRHALQQYLNNKLSAKQLEAVIKLNTQVHEVFGFADKLEVNDLALTLNFDPSLAENLKSSKG